MVDISPTSSLRVALLTLGGTCMCIAVAFLFDSFDLSTGLWRWGSSPLNNVLLPCLLATPLLFLLLTKQRQLTLAHKELVALSSVDPLTQCLNRRAYTALVEGYLASLKTERARNGALLIIDVDFFKSVNDRFGHECGDQALQMISQTIQASLTSKDLVARIGGEEFSVFLPDVDGPKALERSEQIRLAVANSQFHTGVVPVPLTVSVGTVLVRDGLQFTDLYRAADQLMYQAKADGRNRVVVAYDLKHAA